LWKDSVFVYFHMLKIAYTGMAYPCLSVPSLCHLGIAVTSEVSIANAIIQIYGTSNYEQDMKIPGKLKNFRKSPVF